MPKTVSYDRFSIRPLDWLQKNQSMLLPSTKSTTCLTWAACTHRNPRIHRFIIFTKKKGEKFCKDGNFFFATPRFGWVPFSIKIWLFFLNRLFILYQTCVLQGNLSKAPTKRTAPSQKKRSAHLSDKMMIPQEYKLPCADWWALIQIGAILRAESTVPDLAKKF